MKHGAQLFEAQYLLDCSGHTSIQHACLSAVMGWLCVLCNSLEAPSCVQIVAVYVCQQVQGAWPLEEWVVFRAL